MLTELAGLVDLLVGLDEGEVGERRQEDGGGVGEGEAARAVQLQRVGVPDWDAGTHLYLQPASLTWQHAHTQNEGMNDAHSVSEVHSTCRSTNVTQGG